MGGRRPPSWIRKRFTPEEKALAAELARNDVDQEFAEEHIRQACERIQESWTDTDEIERRAIGQSRVEITTACEGDYSINRRPGIKRRN